MAKSYVCPKCDSPFHITDTNPSVLSWYQTKHGDFACRHIAEDMKADKHERVGTRVEDSDHAEK